MDATGTPIADLRETHDLATRSFEDAMELHGDACEEDDTGSVEKAHAGANGSED